MNKLFQAILIIFILMLCSSTTKAFDGNRKGFVLSGGVGMRTFSSNVTNNPAFTIGFTIGYGLDNQNLIVLDRGVNFISYDNTFLMAQDAAVSWFHFFKQRKKSIFTKVSFAYYPDGLYLGGGYMLSNNLQIGCTYMHLTEKWASDKIQLLLSYVAF